MTYSNAARTNLVYLPCCFGEFSECKDKGKGCIHKGQCKDDEYKDLYPVPSHGSLICTWADCPKSENGHGICNISPIIFCNEMMATGGRGCYRGFQR